MSALAALSAVPRLYLAGHNHRRGQAVALEYSDAAPVRYYATARRARAVVERFNRRVALRAVRP